jgi:3-hydroxyisobutyrate dehydrogenase-like beta-hydroxyacid dehydrogenase
VHIGFIGLRNMGGPMALNQTRAMARGRGDKDGVTAFALQEACAGVKVRSR